MSGNSCGCRNSSGISCNRAVDVYPALPYRECFGGPSSVSTCSTGEKLAADGTIVHPSLTDLVIESVMSLASQTQNGLHTAVGFTEDALVQQTITLLKNSSSFPNKAALESTIRSAIQDASRMNVLMADRVAGQTRYLINIGMTSNPNNAKFYRSYCHRRPFFGSTNCSATPLLSGVATNSNCNVMIDTSAAGKHTTNDPRITSLLNPPVVITTAPPKPVVVAAPKPIVVTPAPAPTPTKCKRIVKKPLCCGVADDDDEPSGYLLPPSNTRCGASKPTPVAPTKPMTPVAPTKPMTPVAPVAPVKPSVPIKVVNDEDEEIDYGHSTIQKSVEIVQKSIHESVTPSAIEISGEVTHAEEEEKDLPEVIIKEVHEQSERDQLIQKVLSDITPDIHKLVDEILAADQSQTQEEDHETLEKQTEELQEEEEDNEILEKQTEEEETPEHEDQYEVVEKDIEVDNEIIDDSSSHHDHAEVNDEELASESGLSKAASQVDVQGVDQSSQDDDDLSLLSHTPVYIVYLDKHGSVITDENSLPIIVSCYKNKDGDYLISEKDVRPEAQQIEEVQIDEEDADETSLVADSE